MAKARRTWSYQPPKPSAPKVPAGLKAEVQARADELVETVLKPRYVKPPPEDPQFNYPVDVYTKWYRNYFYFCTKFCVAGSNAVVPFFEVKFARLQYTGGSHFRLSFMRHTGQWIELYHDLTMDECFERIVNDPFFTL